MIKLISLLLLCSCIPKEPFMIAKRYPNNEVCYQEDTKELEGRYCIKHIPEESK